MSESDVCADCEPDPGECCEISVRDKTRNWNFTITEGRAGRALLAEPKKKRVSEFKKELPFHSPALLLSWYDWMKTVSVSWNKTHSFIRDMNV